MNFKKYLAFDGIASRSEYWGVILISWAFAAITMMLAAGFSITGYLGMIIGFIAMVVVNVLTIWAGLATSVRRCKDAGINPWFVLTLIIPYVNIVTTIVFGVLESKTDNKV